MVDVDVVMSDEWRWGGDIILTQSRLSWKELSTSFLETGACLPFIRMGSWQAPDAAFRNDAATHIQC